MRRDWKRKRKKGSMMDFERVMHIYGMYVKLLVM
jgi:hypothetical protein